SVGLFAVYAFVAWTQWPDLAHALAALTRPASYTVGMFLVFWTTGMVVIAVHELGHAFTCKYFGGQVHEMGAMLIYFQPAFYCNVNDAWTFRDRAARLWVTAAGSWIQLVVAGLAAIVWWAAVPDTLISQIALAAMVIGGVTTVLAGAAFGWASRARGAVGVLAFALVLWGALRNKLQEWGRALVTSVREHRALWRSRRFWSRAGGAAVLVAVGGLLIPWPITVQGAFTARPLLELAVFAPEGG